MKRLSFIAAITFTVTVAGGVAADDTQQVRHNQNLAQMQARRQVIAHVFGRPNTDWLPDENVPVWMDGDVFYIPRIEDGTIFFQGGTLHEGGYRFEVLLAENGTMTVARDDGRFKAGERVECRTITGNALLLFRDTRTGMVNDVLRREDKASGGLHGMNTRNFRDHLLAGIYEDRTGREFIFAYDSFRAVNVWGEGKSTEYTFAEAWGDTPAPVIVAGGRAFGVTKTLTGLVLKPMNADTEADCGWTPDTSCPPLTLTKIGYAGKNAEAGMKDDYAFPAERFFGKFTHLSCRVFTKPELLLFAGEPQAENLRIMRNEIYARHNYVFRNKEMQEYFRAVPWYKPMYDDVAGRLSEIENINVALIRKLEHEAKREGGAENDGRLTCLMRFQTLVEKGFMKAPDAADEEQGFHYKISLTCPVEYWDRDVLETLRRQFVRHALSEQYAMFSPSTIDGKYDGLAPGAAIRAIINDWKEDYEALGLLADGDPGRAQVFSRDITASVIFMSGTLLQLRVQTEGNMGGAHGAGLSTSYLFDLKSGRTYSRDDVFKPESAEPMRQLIISRLLHYWEVESEDDVVTYERDAVWRPNTEFALTPEGLLIAYSDYELGAYALGRPSFIIPYASIIPYLRDDTPVYHVLSTMEAVESGGQG